MGPEFRQGLIQIESRAPVVLPQVRVETSKEPSVLRVQRSEGGQGVLEGALGVTMELGEVSWSQVERKETLI